MYPSLYLKKGRENVLERKHPWVFSGAIARQDDDIKEGSVVYLRNNRDEILATAFYHNGSIIARIISFGEMEVDQDYWDQLIQTAKDYRSNILSLPNDQTNCFRLFHGEGDGLPGLVVDIYGPVAVVQAHTLGVYKHVSAIAQAIQKAYSEVIVSVYTKSKDTILKEYRSPEMDRLLIGEEANETIVVENGHQFIVNPVEGQKTGFFLDQRNNREIVGQIAKGKSVLNCFCYTGGFSVYAADQGASHITSIDISEKAMTLVDRNIDLTGKTEHHRSMKADVMKELKNLDELYDVVIVDPPAFAKSVRKRHNAVQAYKRLNILGLQKVKTGGLYFTFSCSQVVNTKLFYDTIVAAGIESGRKIKVMKHLSQGEDHPVNLFHPEGHYLKGLMLYVED